MIAWPILAAQKAGIFDRIIVSTDDAAIAEVAQSAGAETPFLRDAALADDHSGVTEVIRDAIRRLNAPHTAKICLLYATAALVSPEDLVTGAQAVDAPEVSFAISVTRFTAPVQRALSIKIGAVQMMDQANLLVRSQELEPAYHDAGQFCWGRAEAWLGDERVFIAPTAPIILPSDRVQDVDTEDDWRRAELIAKALGFSETTA